jgi:16S rRNA processing protein RimM
MSRSQPDRGWRPDRIEVGRIGKPHGLDGSVTLTGHGGSVPMVSGTQVTVGDTPARVVGRKGTDERPIVRFDIAASREQAEQLRGLAVTVPASALPEPDEDEYFHVDLIGCEVWCGDRRLGSVRTVHTYPANDVLELDGGEMIPFVDEAVEAVDVGGRRIGLREGVL